MSSDSHEHAIREMAYAKWEQAGCPSGDGVHFWLEAEKELHRIDEAEASSSVPAPKGSALSSFRAADPPPLKLRKAPSASKKRAS